MRLQSLLLFFLFFYSVVAHTKNSFVASVYQEFSSGRACRQATKKELDLLLGESCNKQVLQYKGFSPLPNTVFEWGAFQLAADEQILKNQCAVEKIAELKANPQLWETWKSMLALAWLGLKKSELILQTCANSVLKQVQSPSMLRQKDKSKSKNEAVGALFTGESEGDKKWLSICEDEERMAALKASRTLFQYSVPGFSSPEFFRLFGDHMGKLKNNQTQAPLTDADILAMDFRKDLDKLELEINPQLDSQILSTLESLGNERQKIKQQIEKSKTAKGYELDEEIQDYLFQDGTVTQALAKRGFSNSGNNAYCLHVDYSPTLAGELLDIAGTSAFAAGFIYKVAKGSKYMLGLSKGEKIKKSFVWGIDFVGYPMLLHDLKESCPIPFLGNEAARSTKIDPVGKDELMTVSKASKLPEEINYKRWNLKFDIEKTPTCKKVGEQNYILSDNMSNASCVMMSLLAIPGLASSYKEIKSLEQK